jgi:predicted NBD/HSP70 family sugar kinase
LKRQNNGLRDTHKPTNRNLVYQLVYQQGSISKPEIAAQLGISLPTAIQNVKNLQWEGLLEEGITLESTGGRKAVAVTCAKNAKFSIGVDITRNHISAVLINLTAEIIESVRVSTSFENSPSYYHELGQLIGRLIDASGVNTGDILGVGFSVPGILTEDHRMLVFSHVLQVSALQCSNISQGLSYPSILCNDANAAGIAEMWKNKERGNAVYLTLSNTVGGAILIHNELYLGENQRGGEFGHETLVRNGLPCYCGRKGCVDAYCSALVLSKHTGGDLDTFFEGLHSGDENLKAVWNQYAQNLAMVINNLIVSFDCKVILGVYLGTYLEDFIGELKQLVAELTTFPGTEDYISACAYKREAAAVGAALLYIRPFIKAI